MEFILASASPRRKEILSHLGLEFCVVCADADETSDEKNGARLVEILSHRKATAVQSALQKAGKLTEDTVILAADTVVVSPDGEILGKPRDKADAMRMLRLLSDRTHCVISGICVIRGDKIVTAHEVTEVKEDSEKKRTFKRVNIFCENGSEIIEEYRRSGMPAIHHSDAYREAEHPAYRVVDAKLLREYFENK